MGDSIWQHCVELGIPMAEKVVRPIVVYAFLVLGLRLAGKRELGQLNSLDLVVLLTLANTVQNAIIGDDNSVLGGLIGASTLLLINHLFVRFLFRHDKLSRIVQSEPVTLVKQGKLDERALEHELITRDELASAARRQGFGALEEIDCAVLEPSGVITFQGHTAHPDILRQRELLARLDRLQADVGDIRAALERPA